MPVWSVISASVVICRYMRHALICLSCDCVRPTSEAEEWLILVQSGYYNNPVPTGGLVQSVKYCSCVDGAGGSTPPRPRIIVGSIPTGSVGSSVP